MKSEWLARGNSPNVGAPVEIWGKEGLGRSGTLSPGMAPQGAGVQAGSGLASKTVPLQGWQGVRVLGPGSWYGLGELDGGVWAQIPLVEPLLGVGEVGAGAISTDVLRPGFAQVLGGLVRAVQVVML